MKQRVFFQIITILIFGIAGIVSAAEPSKVLILPFAIHAEKDLSFLKDGISDMLSTRLAREELQPMSREETSQIAQQITGQVTEKQAISLAEKNSADYVVYGSITVLGDTISTDAKLYDPRQKKNRVVFHQTGKNSGEVISHINQFATQINNTLFASETPAQAPAAPAARTSGAEKKEEESRRHPEALWKERNSGVKEPAVTSQPSAKPASTPPSSAVPTSTPVPAAKASGDTEEVWKSPSFKTEIRSLDIGDVDGDGRNEIVFANEKDVFVYRYADGTFAKVRDISGTAGDSILSVDVADINKNGKAEIFVTMLTKSSGMLNSYILEWDGIRFSRIAEHLKWYYRVIEVPGKGKILAGQQRGMKDVFTAGIYEIRWNGREYVAGEEQGLPAEANVFGFSYGNILNSGKSAAVFFDKSDRLRLSDKEGKDDWRSSDPYGGSAVFIEYEGDFSDRNRGTTDMDHYYLPQRVLIRDTDKDGKADVIVARNTDTTNRVFSRTRFYKSGYLACLSWDGMGLNEKWKTKEISGHISDYVFADIDNDGKNELVFSVVARIGSAFGDAKSFVVAQKIP